MQSKKDSPVGDNKFKEKPSFYSIHEQYDIKIHLKIVDASKRMNLVHLLLDTLRSMCWSRHVSMFKENGNLVFLTAGFWVLLLHIMHIAQSLDLGNPNETTNLKTVR